MKKIISLAAVVFTVAAFASDQRIVSFNGFGNTEAQACHNAKAKAQQSVAYSGRKIVEMNACQCSKESSGATCTLDVITDKN